MWLPDVVANFLFAFVEGIHITTISRFKRYGLYKPYNLKITLWSHGKSFWALNMNVCWKTKDSSQLIFPRTKFDLQFNTTIIVLIHRFLMIFLFFFKQTILSANSLTNEAMRSYTARRTSKLNMIIIIQRYIVIINVFSFAARHCLKFSFFFLNDRGANLLRLAKTLKH